MTNQIQIQIYLYNCAKINNKNNSPYITFISSISSDSSDSSISSDSSDSSFILKPTSDTICRESCFTLAPLIPQWLKHQIQNTSGVFTIRENMEFLKKCEINNNTILSTGFREFIYKTSPLQN